MISRFKFLSISFLLILNGCFFNNEPQSKISEDQAKIIRIILRANGINIDEKEWVDSYLDFFSSSPHIDEQDRYWIILPADGNHEIILDNNINLLNAMFHGIYTKPGSIVDTIIINSDSLIRIRALGIGNKLRTLPPEIKYLRSQSLSFSSNQITRLPEEIMQLTTPPVLYDSFHIYIENNKIDTINIIDSLDNWLKKYSSPYWKAGQKPD